MSNYKFEKLIIDKILNTIKDNQEYLTQSENLPQLAKLGYMYNSLWYAGRVCWGYDGILLSNVTEEPDYDDESVPDDESERLEDEYNSQFSCEDNPKYKIEMCSPIDDRIENLIYDAWGMHVTNDNGPSVEEFYQIVKLGRELTKLDLKQLKVNKTIEDWVDIKNDPKYKYKSLYGSRKSVIDNLLCTIGTGYGWNTSGFIIEEAGGADQDKAMYGDWENCVFREDIQAVVDEIMDTTEVLETVDSAFKHIDELKSKREREEREKYGSLFSKISGEIGDDDLDNFDLDTLMDEISDLLDKKSGMSDEEIKSKNKEKVEKYHPYYPISNYSSIYAIYDAETQDRLGIKSFDQSYIDASIEICKDILAHEKEEMEDHIIRECNVEFARKFLSKMGFSEYDKYLTKEIDKYQLLSDIENCLSPVVDGMNKVDASSNKLNQGEYTLYLNDTKNNSYADNNYRVKISLDGLNVPIGYSNSVEYLKGTTIYDSLKTFLSDISDIEDIASVFFYVDNGNESWETPCVQIEIKVTDYKGNIYDKDLAFNDDYLVGKGFQVGSFQIQLETSNYLLRTTKPKPLGTKHPHNAKNGELNDSGQGYFSTAKQLQILDKNFNQVANFHIDERGFNILRDDRPQEPSDLKNTILNEYIDMKASNPDYGSYGINDSKKEGKKSLNAHDFMLALKNKI